jgi:hypothetical protein
VEEEGDIVVLTLVREQQAEDLWIDKDGTTLSPANVLSGSADTRQLAVAFDYIAFHPE